MSDYTKTTDFTEKDGLATGTIAKRLKGSEIDTEFDNIEASVATKEDAANKGQADGYAELDSDGLVPDDQLATGTANSTTYLNGNRVWVSTGGFASSGHVHTAADITYDDSGSDIGADNVQDAIDAILAATGIGGSSSYHFVLTGDIENFNLADRIGTVPGSSITVNITIGQGIKVTSRIPTTPAMDLTGLHTGSTINLLNLGLIMGCGGDGGRGGTEYNQSGGPGLGSTEVGHHGRDGGIALKGPGSGNTLNITNVGGYILGGGGGGAGGGFVGSGGDEAIGAGGGGGGAGGGKGADGGCCYGSGGAQRGGNGTDGAMDRTGTASTGGTGASSAGTAGNGGAGGTWGADGSDGTSTQHGTGGTAGLAVSKASGTVVFVSGSGSPHVKGSVT